MQVSPGCYFFSASGIREISHAVDEKISEIPWSAIVDGRFDDI